MVNTPWLMGPTLLPPDKIYNLELYGLAIRRGPGKHTRAVAEIAVVNQHQSIIVYIEHGDSGPLCLAPEPAH